MEHIRLVLDALEKANFRIKLEKCSFFLKNVKLLGWIIGRDGRKIDPKKQKAMSEWPKPQTFPQLARFIGAVGHIRDVIPNCSLMTGPLSEATKGKDIRKVTERNGMTETVEWTPLMSAKFDQLRKTCSSPPVLQLIDPSKEYWMECDASETFISAALFQVHNKKLHPVAYFSRKLSTQEQNGI